MSALRTGRLYFPGDIAGTLFCYKLSHSAAGRINPLNAELNPICHLLALLGAHHILHVSRVRVKSMKTTHNPIGNRIRDLKGCSAVPQPTAPRRAPSNKNLPWKKICMTYMAQDRRKWRDLVNTVTKIRYHKLKQSFNQLQKY